MVGAFCPTGRRRQDRHTGQTMATGSASPARNEPRRQPANKRRRRRRGGPRGGLRGSRGVMVAGWRSSRYCLEWICCVFARDQARASNHEMEPLQRRPVCLSVCVSGGRRWQPPAAAHSFPSVRRAKFNLAPPPPMQCNATGRRAGDAAQSAACQVDNLIKARAHCGARAGAPAPSCRGRLGADAPRRPGLMTRDQT